MIHDVLIDRRIGGVDLPQVRHGGPARVDKFHPGERLRLCITWNHMKVHIGIDHHQHQIIDLVIVEGFCQGRFNLPSDAVQFREAGRTQL